LYAQWAIESYTLNFVENGGSIVTNISGDFGDSITEPNDPTRTGYTFGGWYTDESLTTEFTFPATFPDYGVDGTTIDLYAKWTANIYTVTFNGNGGGTPSPTSKEVTYDSTYGTLATVSRVGHTFNGWYTATSGGTQILSTTTVAITANQTLFAQWTINEYTVSFISNGGTAVNSITQNYDTSVAEPNNPTRTGYTFIGWFTDIALTIEKIFPFNMPDNSLTLYAKWEANEYFINYDPNNGSGAMDVQTLVYDETDTLTINTFTRTGYTFAG
jgi:uncharacterized repeat protein (TIGR02543 family)